jgi:hypothetical protein
MKIARIPNKKRNLILIIALVIGLPLITFAAYETVQYISNASADTKPQNILISNVTTSSITITWTTDSQTLGSVSLLEDGKEQTPVVDKRGNTKRYTHYVELSSLEPNTTYDFLITSNTTKYTSQDNTQFSFKTAPVSTDAPTPNPVVGSVSGVSGDDVIIFATLKDKSAYPVSATMPSGGNWIIDLSAQRKISDMSLVLSSESTNLVLVAVSGSDKGGTISGMYSELFDTDGKLNTAKTLSIASDSTLYSYFSSEAGLLASDTGTNEESGTDTNTNDNTSTDDSNSGSTSSNNSTSVKTEDGGRVFRLVQDLNWVDMSTTSQTGWSYGASTIEITNVTDTGFTVIWVSQTSEQGSVTYGTSTSSLSSQALDERDGVANKGSYFVHSVSISQLQPSTKYFFKVISGSTTYTNNGNYYTVTTFPTLSTPPTYVSVSGVVSNIPTSKEGIVIAYIKDMDNTGSSGTSIPISAVFDEDGKWIMSIADSRTSDGTAYFEYTSLDKMYFDVVSTTVKPETVSISMDGITSKTVSLTLSDTSTTSSVERLSDYGVI